jgi:hypothetical protein
MTPFWHHDKAIVMPWGARAVALWDTDVFLLPI